MAILLFGLKDSEALASRLADFTSLRRYFSEILLALFSALEGALDFVLAFLKISRSTTQDP